MNEEIKKELDQIGDLVDSKIEKAFNSAKDNAKGEIETSLKSEINNLSKEFLAKHEDATKRMDSFEVAQKKAVSSSQPTNFKSSLIKSINDGAIEGLLKGNSNAAKFEMKAGDMTMANAYSGVVAGETVIPDFKFDPSRSVHIRNLIPNGSTDAQTIRFPKESAYDDGAAATAQGSALAQSDFDITATSVNVEKIGTFMRITEEMLADTPQLSSYLSARVPGKVLSIEDNEILNGDGSSPNLDGLFTDGAAFDTTSAGAFYQSVESANEYDVLIAACNQLALSNYQASSILVNPTDLHKIALLKATTNEYLRNQIYSGLVPTIMGVPLIANTAVTSGKFLVGDLNQATQLWIRENLSVEFSREDSTNFRDGFVTVKVSERVALTNYQPNAIVQGTFSTAKTALETA
ncbi:MAG: phage major capsid protein [Flavobacteriales bacterium]|nr:phage major capsid protein [Flavobacteriales bacterium]